MRRSHVIAPRTRSRCAILHGIVEPTAATVLSAATTTAAKSSTRSRVGCLVNTNSSAIEFDVVHGINGLLGVHFLGIAHEAETATAASVPILHDDRFLNSAKLLKLLSQGVLLGVPG
jgi:hypothetical protein